MCDYSADIVRSKLIFTTFSANAKDVKLARIFLCIRNLILDVIAHEKVNFVFFCLICTSIPDFSQEGIFKTLRTL